MNAALSVSSITDANEISVAENIVSAHRVKNVNKEQVMTCQQTHVKKLDETKLVALGEHQMHIKGAQKCCQCAYNSGYEQGALLQHFMSLDIDSLGDASPDSEGRYKNIHQAFALGYSDGVNSFLKS